MEEITIKNKNLLQKIVKNYTLDLLLLFGSRVLGKTHKESDYDIAYLSERELDLEEEAKLIVDLAPIFKSENIDLVNLKKAKPLLLFAITNDAKVVYEKKPLTFYKLRAYAFKKYIETKPFYEEKFKRLQQKLKV